MWWLLACNQNYYPKEAGEKGFQLVYANNMDGDIEPCG